jgi:glycosyltransferase involved in cell wall biosynthesis
VEEHRGRGASPSVDRNSAIVVRGWTGQPSAQELERRAAAGLRPRSPYVELARQLDADVIDASFVERNGSPLTRFVGKRIGFVEGQVLETFNRRRRYRHLVAFADRIGLELALLLKLARGRRDVVLVSNWLTGDAKRIFLEKLRVQSHLGSVISYGSAQIDLAVERYGIRRSKFHLALQPVDDLFWRPEAFSEADVICSVGWERRDYRTLLEAVREMPVGLEMAVGSLILSPDHRRQRAQLFSSALAHTFMPERIQPRFDLTPCELRALYARSRFVVIPLEQADYDAGVTSVTEAMAMGRAVIVTRTKGQVDVIREGIDGIYVPPGDVRALRDAIDHLLANPDEAERMGRAGREAILQRHRLDTYVERVATIVREGTEAAGDVEVVASTGAEVAG